MRQHGLMDEAGGLGLHDHACWAYESREELRTAVVDHLREGLRLSQRLLYVGPGPREELMDDLAGLPDVEALLARDALAVLPLGEVYEAGAPADLEGRLERYRAATERALADGYAGLRVAAEVTELATEPAHREGHLRWECVADRYMSERPLCALCLYDRRALPPEALADLCHVHPAAHAPRELTGFRMFAQDGATVLAGELDCFTAARLERVLPATVPPEGEHTIDLRALRFSDHHGVLAISRHVGRLTDAGRKVTIRNAPYQVRRISQLMDLPLAL